ncbi:16S rRNA (uracil(1498)-N(3))-methyltransferase [Psychrobacter nivimaris]|uniref:Ribosomal RNA small subunit methyltransferase E n=1 Tax=Psychrobacter nivimaris TaxID=281738 RepID=A0A6N7BW93_9GAMM|nr:16S rRNA (uracil(1498)-N(3))-methyltransferase [Psychrobacter nivimaris]KAF0568259.1 16S rRNA (uracil(1498)-N(3))-methyltransferase [Psychrobacter nivimaris]
MRRFFYAVSNDNADASALPKLGELPIGSNVELPDSIVHHWCRVLRANIGDQGILFDGFGGEYIVELQAISKKNATATLLTHIDDDRTPPTITQIGLVMSRGERMDYAIQKATELGVTAIQLLSSHHGEVTLKPAQVDKKLAHWQQVAIAACEQCGLNRPPLILSPLSINDWLKSLDSDTSNRQLTVSPIVALLSQDTYYQALLQPADLCMQMSVPAAGQPAMPDNLLQILKQETPYIKLLIGPEGGLSPDERQQASSVGFRPWQIGPRVLRTETAPVVALSTLHALSV